MTRAFGCTLHRKSQRDEQRVHISYAACVVNSVRVRVRVVSRRWREDAASNDSRGVYFIPGVIVVEHIRTFVSPRLYRTAPFEQT